MAVACERISTNREPTQPIRLDGAKMRQRDSSCKCGIFRSSVGRNLAEAVGGASRASGQDMHDAARLKGSWSCCRSTG
jgi:hypothetical protein